MANRKEYAQRKEEIKTIFREVHQIAYAGASPILREALDKYKDRFEELTTPKKKGGDNID